MRFRATLAILIALLLAPSLALAQDSASRSFEYYYSGTGAPTAPPSWLPVSPTTPLPVTISGGGGGLSVVDGTVFTAGTSPFTPTGCEYNSSPTTLTSGAQGTLACNQYRSAFVDVMPTNNNLYTALTASQPAGTNNIGNVGSISQYPNGATPVTASTTGTTAATTATLAASASVKTYICGYSIRGNATAAATNTNTVTGVVTGTLSSTMWWAPLALGIGLDEQIFIPCIPSSAINTAIAVVSGAPGSGGAVSVKAWGYQL